MKELAINRGELESLSTDHRRVKMLVQLIQLLPQLELKRRCQIALYDKQLMDLN